MAQTKKFATFTNMDWRVFKKALEIASEREAVTHALQTEALYFNTFDVQMINGKEVESKTLSSRRYVGLDKVYTRDEMIKVLQTDAYKQVLQTRGVHPGEVDEYVYYEITKLKVHPKNTVYITDRVHPGDYLKLKTGEKVFGSQGQQLWPAPSAPAPQKSPKPPRP